MPFIVEYKSKRSLQAAVRKSPVKYKQADPLGGPPIRNGSIWISHSTWHAQCKVTDYKIVEVV